MLVDTKDELVLRFGKYLCLLQNTKKTIIQNSCFKLDCENSVRGIVVMTMYIVLIRKRIYAMGGRTM